MLFAVGACLHHLAVGVGGMTGSGSAIRRRPGAVWVPDYVVRVPDYGRGA